MTISESLLAKSIESITLAIELYNKPLIKYRTESVIILLINSWENVLKSLIKKKKWAKIYNKKRNESKSFHECLECVKSELGNSYSNDWYESTRVLYQERCKITHYHKGIDLLDYMLIQANIILFKNFVGKHFGKSIIKDRGWYILPVATELPYTDFDFVKNTSSLANASTEITSYLKKVVEIHTKQIESGVGTGILVNVKVSLENITRIKDASLIVGVNNTSDKKVSLSKEVKLSDEGRSVYIQEVTDALKKYRFHYKDILKAAREMKGHSQNRFTDFIKEIKQEKKVAFDWGTFSHLFPMKISKKFTYDESILEEYRKFLEL